MKNKEVIQLLQQYPPDADILIACCTATGYQTIEKMWLRKDERIIINPTDDLHGNGLK